jgi:hypothetical protein
VREKSAVKKTKVHKALKIHTSNDSNETSKPKETPAQEKETLVETDQNVNVEEGKVSGPNEDPLPQPEPLVEDHNTSHEGKQDAPNIEKETDPTTNQEVKNTEVIPFSISNFIFSLNL